MKKSILLSLILGLLLAGCSRSHTDSKKVASNDPAEPNPLQYDSPAATGQKGASDQSQVAAPSTPASATSKDATAAAPYSQPDSSQVAANPTTPASTTPAPTPADSAQVAATSIPPASTPTSDKAGTSSDAKADLNARLTEWKLNPDDIKQEVEMFGRVVRSRKAGAGEPTGPMDSILTGEITSKFANDPSISALRIDVSAEKGVVTLKGSAHSLDQIGIAIALSLDTAGVTQTISELKLDTNP